MNLGLIPKIYSAVKFSHVYITAKSLNERRQPAGASTQTLRLT
jgi:hypothetical protein